MCQAFWPNIKTDRMNEIALHILDIVQNSIAAGAMRIQIEIVEDTAGDSLAVTVGDDGCGMDAETAGSAGDPFTTSRTTRKVGLGLPLFKAGCLGCDGSFEIVSEKGAGTTVRGRYRLSHIDRPPLGSIADTVYMLIAANPKLDIAYRHEVSGRECALDTGELRQVLGDVPLDNPDVLQWIRQNLNEMENDLHGGATIE